MTYYLHNNIELAHVAIFYRNFAKVDSKFSHVGLGVNGLHTAKVLRKHKVRTDLFGVREPVDVDQILSKTPSITHCIIEAVWINTDNLSNLLHKYPHIQFVVRVHSQIGFLQVEPGAIQLLREQLHLQESSLNLTISGNSDRFCDFVEEVYGSYCVHLPNLYDMERAAKKQDEHNMHKLIRISSFGALRLMKNHTTAASAAMKIARDLNRDLEFHVTVNREEHGKGVLQSLKNMFTGLRWAKLVEVPWEPWSQFRHTVSHMDLCIQVSSSETFNIVSADAVSEGVPCVVSAAIEWAPTHWIADIDDPDDIAKKGMHLIVGKNSAHDGFEALQQHQDTAIKLWLNYLSACSKNTRPSGRG